MVTGKRSPIASPPAALAPPGATPLTGRQAIRSSGPLFSVAKRPQNLALRVLWYAEEGFGKTAASAHAPGASFVLGPGEDGYETLLWRGLVPELPVARPETLLDLYHFLDRLAEEAEVPGWLVLDALGSFQEMLFEYITATEYNGVRGEKGFLSYQGGYRLAGREMERLLSRLERVRERGCNILLLAHATVGKRPNPEGRDFPRHQIQLHEKVYEPLIKWVDLALMGRFQTDVKEVAKGVVRGVGGSVRVLSAANADWMQAKNRFGDHEDVVVSGNTALDTWKALESFWKGD